MTGHKSNLDPDCHAADCEYHGYLLDTHAADRAALAEQVRSHNFGRTLHPQMAVDCIARAAVLTLIEERHHDHADD